MPTTAPALAGEPAEPTGSDGPRAERVLPLEVRGVTRRYGRRLAIEAVDLTLHEGESVLLLGPNGAGKTTLLHVIAGVLRPDVGEVRVLGRSCTHPHARRALGLAPQALGIYPRLTVRENLEFFARVLGLPPAVRAERVRFGLALSQLGERADQRAGALSGGMQRRLNLACAVLHGPRVLLLDEPTAGVDPASREQLMAAIEAQRRTGVAVVCSTHMLDEAERLAGRVLVLHGGRVRADAPPAVLVARENAPDLRSAVLALTCAEGAPR